MKILCAILIAIVVVHLQCGGSCLGESSKIPVSTDPPCHQHSNTPKDSDQPHESNNRCGQGSLIEAKAAGFGRHVLQPIAFIVPAAAPTITFGVVPIPVAVQSPPDLSTITSTVSILRI